VTPNPVLLLLGALLLGALVGVLGVYALHSKRAGQERAVLRRALASSNDWWWRTDTNLRVREAESCRGGPPGLELDSLRGRGPWQLSGPARSEPPPRLAEAVARRLPFHDVELEVALAADQARTLRLSGAPLYSPTGKYCGYAGVASLLAGPIGADSLGRIRRHELAVRELESFAYSVSHDLRAPLRVIDGFAQIVLEDYGDRLDALGSEHLKRIVAAASRMNSMIDTLLEMSRMTGRELQFERIDLSETARQLAEELRVADPDRSVEVAVQPGLSVEGDRTLLRLVLQNLLGNAFKFSAKTRDARIEFGRRPDGDHAFFVRDNGAGFDMRFADRLFGMFQRLHSQSEFAGTGVGLATVQRIVRRHSGRIWAESEPGKGATFFFTMWEPSASRAESS
jgi:signal transduction histidine kinase